MIVGAALFQDALASLLEQRIAVDVLRSDEASQAAIVARRASPDIVLLELTPDGRHLSLLRPLARLRPAPRTVLISNHATPETIHAGIEAGAHACISTEGGMIELMRAFDAVQEDQRYIGTLIGEVIRRKPSAPVAALQAEQLTGRERQVLGLIAQGHTEREIAKQLGLSPRTVHTYRTSIMSKLRVHNVIALVRRALDLGLVPALLACLPLGASAL